MFIEKSAFPYTGNKFKLMEQLIPMFPRNISNFHDVFTGGGTVALNATHLADKVYAYDPSKQVIDINKYIQSTSVSSVCMNKIVSEVSKETMSYEAMYYNDRDVYNKSVDLGCPDNRLLYTLICRSFNNQIRFNKKGHFNLPYGKRYTFDAQTYNRHHKISKDIIFTNCSYRRAFDFDFDDRSFIYLDPPYLLTCATYNKGWTEVDEKRLYKLLDALSFSNVKWALSNVDRHKGLYNNILIDWCLNMGYTRTILDKNYDNCSRWKTKKDTREVLITNYEPT